MIRGKELDGIAQFQAPVLKAWNHKYDSKAKGT